VERAVLEALVDCLAFIEQSPDDVIDPDAAVRALEDVASRLAALAPREREPLLRRLRALAEEADAPRREFIERMPESLGLTS
jgi:hypothetical protein